ncbi:MAG: hypothetical protein AAF329_01965 [Cyanobacteria bacterium P01_A01_bin.17]
MRLFIIDTQVILHQIACILEKRFGKASLTPEQQTTAALYVEYAIAHANNLGWVPYFQQADDECLVVWVDDSKPYWRTTAYPDYKGKRSRKPHYDKIFNLVCYHFNECDVPMSVIRFPTYEADDIAAAIVRLWLESERKWLTQIHLCTVDSDWHGLVVDPAIYWLGTRDFVPRVRTRPEIYNWLMSQWNKQSKRKQRLWALPGYHDFQPDQIWNWKAAAGDRSDNLPEGTPHHMINLMKPPRTNDLTVDTNTRNRIFRAIAIATQPNIQQGEQALQAIHFLGLTTPITTLAFPRQLDTAPV